MPFAGPCLSIHKDTLLLMKSIINCFKTRQTECRHLQCMRIIMIYYWRQLELYLLLCRHNGRDGVSNHQPNECLLNRSSRRRSKKTSKLRVTGLCAGNSPVSGEFPAQMASNAENVSIWWRHHVGTMHSFPFQIQTMLWFIMISCIKRTRFVSWTINSPWLFVLAVITIQLVQILPICFKLRSIVIIHFLS